jgi:hypothetical protein
MWEPRRLTTLWASTTCFRDSFTYIYRIQYRNYETMDKSNDIFVSPCNELAPKIMKGHIRKKHRFINNSANLLLNVKNQLQVKSVCITMVIWRQNDFIPQNRQFFPSSDRIYFMALFVICWGHLVFPVYVVTYKVNKKLNSMVWVRERTTPTERPPLVGEVIANFCG